jgi:ubiquinone biosynthesis protein
MVQREQNRSDRTTLKQRRDHVLERLSSFGLTRGPHRIVHAPHGRDVEASYGLKLRLALAGLGPIFSAFGLYLATRVDLLSAADCVELQAIADSATPMAEAHVRQLLKHEIGCAPEHTFLSFESQPFEARLLHQLHRARLRNGTPVVVKLVHAEAAQQLPCDLELLELLETRGVVHKGAAADFSAVLRQQMDLAHEATALETLRRDTEDLDMVRVPEVLRNLSTASMLTVEHLGCDANTTLDGAAVARLLCSAWLRQALTGHTFPVEPSLANIALISNKQIAFTGGAFSSLPGESQTNLWNYLIAAAGDSPDQACSCLLREVRVGGPLGADEDLRHRFRQVVPFRDSGWYSDDNLNHLIEHLVVHWQAATDCGYVPHSHVPSFYRGLFTIARVAQQLSPRTEPLLEGLQEARLLESVARMRQMFSLQHVGDQVDRYTALMMAVPQKLDDALTLAAAGSARVKLHVPETASRRQQKNSTAVMTAMLLLLAAVAFALPRVTSSFVGNEWAGRINAVAFVACGALLLLAASRMR